MPVVRVMKPSWTAYVTIHNDQPVEPRFRLVQLLDEASPAMLLLYVRQNVDIPSCVAKKKAIPGPDFNVEVPHPAEASHQSSMPLGVVIGRIGRIVQ